MYLSFISVQILLENVQKWKINRGNSSLKQDHLQSLKTWYWRVKSLFRGGGCCRKKILRPRKGRRKQFGSQTAITNIKSKYTETRITNQFHLYWVRTTVYVIWRRRVACVPYVTSQVKVTHDISLINYCTRNLIWRRYRRLKESVCLQQQIRLFKRLC